MIVLGIDLGTTKSAAVLFDTKRNVLIASASKSNGCGKPSVSAILSSVESAINALPEAERRKAEAIGITGQMHGVLCWNSSGTIKFENWQSTLAAETGTLERIHQIPGCSGLSSGFGFATLAVPGWGDGMEHAAALTDYFACLLTGKSTPVIEATNAASWGLWKLDSGVWDYNAISRLGIRNEILPELIPSGSVVGNLNRELALRFGLPEGIPVKVSIGDNPAAILGSGGIPEEDVYLTIGTGAQLAFVLNQNKLGNCRALELRPFPGGKYLAVSAALCGGKSIEIFANFIREILKTYSDAIPSDDELYRKIAEYVPQQEDALKVSTHFMGERHAPDLRGGIENIGIGNFHFSTLARAWHEGILDSLFERVPPELLNSRKRIIANGNAIRKSPMFQGLLRERFPALELILPDSHEEAACGAAKYASMN